MWYKYHRTVINISIIIGLLLTLSSCHYAVWTGDVPSGSGNRDGDSNYNYSSASNQYQAQYMLIYYKDSATGLTASQTRAINKFLARGYTDLRVSCCINPNITLAADQERVQVLEGYLRSQGYYSRYVPQSNQSGNCLILYGNWRVAASDQCPNLSSPGSGLYKISSNFGCATVRNEKLMLANPNDLTNPKSATVYDSNPLARGVANYREGKNQALPANNTTTSSQIIVGG